MRLTESGSLFDVVYVYTSEGKGESNQMADDEERKRERVSVFRKCERFLGIVRERGSE